VSTKLGKTNVARPNLGHVYLVDHMDHRPATRWVVVDEFEPEFMSRLADSELGQSLLKGGDCSQRDGPLVQAGEFPCFSRTVRVATFRSKLWAQGIRSAG
jgi:hypothetical protein